MAHNTSETMDRVHTQFWADLNNKVDITKIENEVWVRMSTEAEQSRNEATASAHGTSSAAHRRTPPTAAGAGNRTNDSGSVRPSSKDSSIHGVASHSKEISAAADDEVIKDDASAAVDGAISLAPPSTKFAGILGYEELGHVPTLDEFRSEWPKLRSRSELASPSSPEENGVGGGSKGSRRKLQPQGGGQTPQQGPGSVVNELTKKDKVFRRFKKYYDKADHRVGRVGDALFSAGVSTTGLLRPDLDVIETVGRHTEQRQESWGRNRIGEGLLSASKTSTGASRRSGGGGGGDGRQNRQSSREATPGGTGSNGHLAIDVPGDGSDGLTNVFWDNTLGGDGAYNNSGEDTINPFLPHSRSDANRSAAGSGGSNGERVCVGGKTSGDLASICGATRGRGGVRGPHSAKSKGGADSGRAKASVEGSSTSAELQVSLESNPFLPTPEHIFDGTTLRKGHYFTSLPLHTDLHTYSSIPPFLMLWGVFLTFS